MKLRRKLLATTPLLALVGPTAVGKTELAIAVAQKLKGEIIGLDSRQIYGGLEIGTAQPTPDQRRQVPHHLIGLRPPDQPISAGEYAQLVEGVLEDILQRGNQPIFCGGAGLYYRALVRGIFPGSVSDLKIREKLGRIYDEEGPEVLLERLQRLDPEYADLVHPNNKKRLVRALEIWESTHKTPTEHFRAQARSGTAPANMYTVLITRDQEELYERIEARTVTMLAQGWVGELVRLKAAYPNRELFPLDSIGYRQIERHLQGALSYQDMVAEINLKTRQYAKRQLQWFRQEVTQLTLNLTRVGSIENARELILRGYKTFLIDGQKK